MSNKNYSNSITLVRVADGESASSYFIETNYDEILRFETSVGLVFSPDVLYFKVLDLSKNSQKGEVISNFDWELSYLSNNNEYISIASKESNNYPDFLNYLSPFSQNPENQQEAVTIEETKNPQECLYFYISDFHEFLGESEKENDRILLDLFNSNSPVLKFSYIQNGYTRAEKIFVMKNGISADMAKLDINAFDIVASIQEASLRFSANGLELRNGDFLIKNQEDEPVFYLDETTGNLAIKGDVYAENGHFKGIIEATSGTFNGDINANGGTIGGFRIASEKDGDKKIDYLQSIGGNIKLNGTDGEIIAEKIILGAGAKVSESIEFISVDGKTSAKIFNPQKNSNLWLSAGQTALYTDGRLNLGTIELNGGTGKNDGYITSKITDLNGQQQEGYWRINENGTAQFKNIYADEVHLQNSILEIGTIQNVGSLMVFKDAWAVVDFYIDSKTSKMIIILNKSNTLTENDWIFSNDKIYKVLSSVNKEYYELIDEEMKLAIQYIEGNTYYEKLEEDSYQITSDKGFYSYITIDSETFEGKVVTKFGKGKENLVDEECDYIISIFGESKKGPDIRNFATPNSLTISSFNITENNPMIEYTKHLILGKLSDSGIEDLKEVSGFGLYSDNVYLNGSLTTYNKENGYAGINTASSISFNKSKNIIQDSSSIIFWGGAGGEIAIADAPFQVTANGTLYTQQAIIENSIVAGADIYGSRIYAAELHGWDDKNQSGELAIYDSSKGIVFKEESKYREISNITAENFNEQELYILGSESNYVKATTFETDTKYYVFQESTLFSIKGEGFQQSSKSDYFINLNGSIPLFIGDFKTKPNSNNNIYLEISENNLSFYNNTNQLAKIVGQIDNSNDDQSYMDFQINDNDSIFELRATKIEAKKDVYINNNMELGSHTMTYKKVSDGYDLYVY